MMDLKRITIPSYYNIIFVCIGYRGERYSSNENNVFGMRYSIDYKYYIISSIYL